MVVVFTEAKTSSRQLKTDRNIWSWFLMIWHLYVHKTEKRGNKVKRLLLDFEMLPCGFQTNRQAAAVLVNIKTVRTHPTWSSFQSHFPYRHTIWKMSCFPRTHTFAFPHVAKTQWTCSLSCNPHPAEVGSTSVKAGRKMCGLSKHRSVLQSGQHYRKHCVRGWQLLQLRLNRLCVWVCVCLCLYIRVTCPAFHFSLPPGWI